MKIYLSTPGDPSVGLQGDEILIDWNWNLPELTETFPGGREECRRAFAAFFGQMTDGPPQVQFEGECGECGADTDAESGKCPEPRCVSNLDLD